MQAYRLLFMQSSNPLRHVESGQLGLGIFVLDLLSILFSRRLATATSDEIESRPLPHFTCLGSLLKIVCQNNGGYGGQ